MEGHENTQPENETEDWLMEELITTEIVSSRVEELVDEILDKSTRIGERSAFARMEKETRLKKGRRRKERLLIYLDSLWTTLEGGVPDLEVEMEPHSCQRGEKRKKEPTKKDRIREEEMQSGRDVAG